MSDIKEKIEEEGIEAVDEIAASDVAPEKPTAKPLAPALAPSREGERGERKRNFRRSAREARVKPEFDQKIINIRRVARVAAGGRRFSFSVSMIIGNRRGSVGVGTGKGGDTAVAIDKAARNAKKHLLRVTLTDGMSITHRVEAKYSSARIMLMPSGGRGVVAGGAVRSVLELAGIRDVTAKIFSPSKNGLNTARATVKALSFLRSRTVAHKNKEPGEKKEQEK